MHFERATALQRKASFFALFLFCGIVLVSIPLLTAWMFFQLVNTSKNTSVLPVFDRCTVQHIDQLAKQLMKDNHIPGMAVGVVKNNRVVYRKGFGVASIASGDAVTPETVFQLGSESKMMVGTAIMQLQAQGKLNIDTPLFHYLPYFQLKDPRYKKITLRQVLSHRSGLPYCLPGKGCDFEDYLTPAFDEQALERHARGIGAASLLSEPGEKMQYSDIGFEMLGDVMARVSGESFEDYVSHHIFQPLGMTRSSFLLRDIPPASLAAPHVLNKNTLTVNRFFPYSRQHAPSSHLFSTVDDMNRFALAHLRYGELDGVRVLPASAYAEMWSPQIHTNMPSPWEQQLGLGWFLGEVDGHRVRGHAGGDTGFAGELMLAPDDGVAVVAMVNREFYVEEFSTQIMHWLLTPSAQGSCVSPAVEITH